MKRIVPDDGSRYLSDESGLVGRAESVYIPESVEELDDILELTYAGGAPATIRGGGTGINGAAVPECGRVISMEALDRALQLTLYDRGDFAADILVEAGMTLKKLKDGLKNGELLIGDRPLRDIVEPGSLYFRPDPTETSATLGGLFMTNAMGPNGIPFSGEVSSARFSSPMFDRTSFVRGLNTFGEKGLECFPLTEFRVDTVFGKRKRTAPLSPRIGDDALELFAGSEGMLAVCSAMQLRLYKSPQKRLSVAILHRGDGTFDLQNEFISIKEDGARVDSVDVLDRGAIECAESLRASSVEIAALPAISGDVKSIIIAEFSADGEDQMGALLDRLLDITEKFEIDEQDTWVFDDDTGMSRLRALRHAASEGINLCQAAIVREGGLKLIADLSGDGAAIEGFCKRAKKDAEKCGFSIAVITHAVDPRVHIALLLMDMAEYDAALEVFREWMRNASGEGLCDRPENGFGKLKYRIYDRVFNDIELAMMARVKTAFDPAIMLNRGNLIALERDRD